jgi:hypothetical protein
LAGRARRASILALAVHVNLIKRPNDVESREEVHGLASLNIPERYRGGLSVLVRMPNESYANLVEALKRTPNAFSTKGEVAEWVSSEIRDIPEGEIRKLVDFIASLGKLRSSRGVEVHKLAHDASVAASEAIPGLSAPTIASLENRLNELLPLASMAVVADKAKELQLEREKTFCSARVVTDIRPVFGNDATEEPTLMTVIQTLRIGYHESGSPGHKELYIALDASDITSLKAALDRAEKKAKTLKTVMEATRIRLVDLA